MAYRLRLKALNVKVMNEYRMKENNGTQGIPDM